MFLVILEEALFIIFRRFHVFRMTLFNISYIHVTDLVEFSLRRPTIL